MKFPISLAGIYFLLASLGNAQSTTAFQDGQTARQAWEGWISSITGDYRIGAEYWASQRSKPHPGSCFGADNSSLGDITAGCLASQQRLAPIDVRRRAEPDYRAGFNSYTPSEAAPPTPHTASAVPNTSEDASSSAPINIKGQFTATDIPMLLSHTDPNEFVANYMGKPFLADGKFLSFEPAPVPAQLFMVSVMTDHGQVSCFYDKNSGVSSMPFRPSQSVVISGNLGMSLNDVIILEQGCSVKAFSEDTEISKLACDGITREIVLQSFESSRLPPIDGHRVTALDVWDLHATAGSLVQVIGRPRQICTGYVRFQEEGLGSFTQQITVQINNGHIFIRPVNSQILPPPVGQNAN